MVAGQEGNGPERSFSGEDCVLDVAIMKLKAIECTWLQKLLYILVIILIGKIVLDLALNGAYAIDHSAMLKLAARNSVYAIIIINIILFFKLIQSIPAALESLWVRGIVKGVSKDEKDCKDEIEKNYCYFVKEFERSLNTLSHQIILGSMLAIMVLVRSFFEFWSCLPKDFWTSSIYLAGGRVALIEGIKLHLYIFLTHYSLEDPLGFISMAIFDPLLGFLLGLIAWKMLTTVRYIGFLNKRFVLDPLMQHPDGHGGLECLGRIYLLIASVIGVWGFLFCFWLVLERMLEINDFSTPLVIEMLAVFAIIMPRSFSSSFCGLHKLLQKKKEHVIKSIDIQISMVLMEEACPGREHKERENLKRMTDYYDKVSASSVWPFGKLAWVNIAFSQTLAAIGVIVSFYKMLALAYSLSQELNLW